MIVLTHQKRTSLLEGIGLRHQAKAVLESGGEDDGIVAGGRVEHPQQPALRVRDMLEEGVVDR